MLRATRQDDPERGGDRRLGTATAGQARAGHQPGGRVARRRVFYIPGYDPFPARRYREIYRREAALQAGVSGFDLTLEGQDGSTTYPGWRVRARFGDKAVTSVHSVLVWSDIVRQSMARGVAGTYALMMRVAWVYIATGALWRLIRLRPTIAIAAFYPVAMLLLQAGLAASLGWAVARVAAAAGLPAAVGLVAAGAAALAVLHGFRRLDGRLYVHYLMHQFAFVAQGRGAYPATVEARLAAFRDTLRAALDEDGIDEVLVVGHSAGTHLAVSLLADLLRGDDLPARRPALGLMTLGQCLPLQSFLPGAGRLRDDLRFLADRDDLFWLDVTAPGDGCCFALCDPVAVSGVAPPTGQRWPLVISAAFSQTLRPETWARLRRRFFRLHFQYLHAFDAPGDWDYFTVTAGPLTLAARYAGRNPSPGRRTVPLGAPLAGRVA